MKEGIQVPTAKESPTVAKICKSGVLRGGLAPFAPHAFQDAKGTYRGPAVEIIGPTVAKLLGVRFQVVPVGWEAIVPGLLAGRYELITSGLTYTPERAKLIDYVIDAVGGTCYVVRKDGSLKTLQDLNSPDVTIGVYTGTSWETDLPKIFPKAKFNTSIEPQGGGYRLTDVLAKRIDAAPIDNVAALPIQTNYADLRIVPPGSGCLTNPEPKDRIGVGLPKDSAFQAFVQAVVTKHHNAIDAMMKKYMTPTYIPVGHQ